MEQSHENEFPDILTSFKYILSEWRGRCAVFGFGSLVNLSL